MPENERQPMQSLKVAVDNGMTPSGSFTDKDFESIRRTPEYSFLCSMFVDDLIAEGDVVDVMRNKNDFELAFTSLQEF